MDSQAIVNTMEVLETKSLNDLVSEATIKVCYVAESPNNNNTVIDKEAGRQIGATLPGAPVVGLFDKNTNDFVEHSRKIIFNKDGTIEWEDLTRPYGFVSPIHKPWFQDFMENGKKRTYLMCKAYLWTRQYKEASLIKGKGQSMELNEKEMAGYYEGDVFIFTKATLDKLCILGDKYAPCFEGAKFMTTYAKGYEALSKEVENIIGRRYYVLNDKLVEKPISLDYAVQLGWDLEDAVYRQLVNRGAEERYEIKGLYTEGEETFVILQERASQEMVKVSIEITSADTVILGTDMVAVSMRWIPKPPSDETRIEPLIDNEAVATETPASTTSTMKTTSNYTSEDTVVEPVSTEVPDGDGIKDQKDLITETPEAANTEPATIEEGQKIAEDGISQAAGIISEGENQEPNTEAPNVDPVNQDTGVNSESANTSSEASEGNSNDGNSDEGGSQGEGEGGEAEGSSEGSSVGASEFAALNEKVTNLEQQLAQKDNRISELEGQLNEYRKKEKEAEDKAKNEIVTSYKSLLSEDEMKPVIDELAKLNFDEVESKLSVTFARKQLAESTTRIPNIQVNIESVDNIDTGLPEFMRKAIEYDRSHGFQF